MLVAAVADVHAASHRRMGGPSAVGLNQRAREVVGCLKAAAARALALDADIFVVLGDLFDHLKPEPQLIRAVQDALEVPSRMAVVLLAGNHDRASDAPGDHALGPLGAYARLVERPAVVPTYGRTGALLLVPPVRGEGAWSRAEDELAALLARERPFKTDRRLLCLHAGLSDARTPPWLRGAPGSIQVEEAADMAERLGCTAVLAGDWHEHRAHRVRGVDVVQVGALCPTGFDNPGLDGYGTLALWDGGRPTYEEIPGPRFAKVPFTSADVWAALAGQRGCSLRLSCAEPAQDLALARAHLTRLQAEQPALVGWEVVLDGVEEAQAARGASQAARSAEGLLEAAAGYVERMPLPPGVDRDAVRERVLDYLGAPKI